LNREEREGHEEREEEVFAIDLGFLYKKPHLTSNIKSSLAKRLADLLSLLSSSFAPFASSRFKKIFFTSH